MAVSASGEKGGATRCVTCGRPASVTVVIEDDWGARRTQEFCLECAEKRPPLRSHAGRAALAAVAPRWLIRIGAAIALLALSADYLGIAGKHGFGWRQLAGGEVGTLVLVVGVLLRSGVTTLAGLVFIVLSLGADLLRVGHSPGIGWRQQLALPLAALCVAAGFAWLRLQRHRSGSDASRLAAGGPPDDATGEGSAGADSRRETLH